MPKVTIILTSFNHEWFIREAIDSVLNQTFTDFELIIWDDASTDGSWEVINSYSDSRIKAFRNEVSKRGIYGINKSISEIATGEYIAIHHSDDVWELDKLEKQVLFLDANSDIGAVFTWVQVIDEHGVKSNGNWFDQENKTQWQWLNLLFMEINHLNHPSVLIRKHCYQDVGVYRYGLAQTGDAEMWSRLLLKYPIHIIQEKLTMHRLFSDNSNTSGARIDVGIRLSNEWNVIRENYLVLTRFKDVVAIFPNLERFRNNDGFDIQFLLAMACLYESEQRNSWQLGLKWLFELISDESRYKKIRELYSFSYKEFIKLTATFNVYLVGIDKQLDEQVKAMDEQAKVMDEQVKAMDEQAKVIDEQVKVMDEQVKVIDEQTKIINEQAKVDEQAKVIGEQAKVIEEIYASSSWRWTKPFRTAKMFLNRTQSIINSTSNRGIECYQAQIINPLQDNRPRVVHVIGNFMTGGSSRLVVDLFERLGHLYDQEVITQFNPNPPNFIGIPIYEFKGIQSYIAFVAYLHKFKPKLVHVHYWGSVDELWYAQMIKAAHTFDCTVIENINTPVEPYIDDCVSRYVYVSDYVRNTFGITDRPSLTIYPGSNFRLFSRGASQAIPDDCIGMVYRLDVDKLNESAIDVFIKVALKRPQTKIIIVGGGAFLDPYKAAVVASKVESSFKFTGFVDYEKLPELYAQMSLFVAPVWKESFGQVSPFAMSMGIPVVGYNVGALAEIIDDSSLLAPPNDSDTLAKIIIDLLNDKQRREQIGQRNRELALSQFSVESMIDSYAKLYKELVENK